MRRAYWLVVFVLLTFSLIAIDLAIVSNYLPILQESYSSWRHKPANFILSDILFIEGALLLVARAVFAGFSLYTMVVPGKFTMAYVKSVFNWETIKKEHDISATLKIGLILLGAGIVAISIAIIVTL